MFAKVCCTFVAWEDVYWLGRVCIFWSASGSTLVQSARFLLYISSFSSTLLTSLRPLHKLILESKGYISIDMIADPGHYCLNLG